ncbi:Ser/Thr protein phosphatase [Histomonas meleagridis]|uniref:Ser/Thr protein phosphatase n=1 Tax=Histomonas meleagridis TaxID=135588 RepID=UPI0035597262|nr:Ser/Thr protein phosphatase [Histomonas meleagridis]KAH0799655.1 Ser/Thr protein phosphatase [Histomonas meleagridis]
MVTSDLLIKLTHPNPKPGEISNLYMTHDLGEPLRLTRTQCKSYMLALKQVNSNVIGAEDYLLTGHTHECVEVPDERCSCLKPMSVDLNFFGYALITAENGFVVQHFDDARLH